MAQKSKGLRSKFSGKALLKRTEEAHQRMNDYGKFGRFYAIPAGDSAPLKTWKCKEGEHIIDIIPFLAGPNHHQVREGEPTYLLDIWVHQKVGMDENDVVCLARNYNEPCPICEYINAQRLNKDLEVEAEAALKALNPKRRCLYNIVCYNSTREENRGVQLWEVAHFLFEKKILSVARNPRGGGFVPFSSPDNGSSIYFEREGSGITNTQYLGHKFIERQTAVTDEILEQAYILDALVIKLPYKEIKEALLGGLIKPEKKPKPESGTEAGSVEGDNIPEDTNRVAQRMASAKKTEARDTLPGKTRRTPPLAGSNDSRASAGTQRRPTGTQQRRPTSGGTQPTGQRSTSTRQRRPTSGGTQPTGQRSTSTRQRKQ